MVNHSGTSARDPRTRSGPLFENLARYPLKKREDARAHLRPPLIKSYDYSAVDCDFGRTGVLSVPALQIETTGVGMSVKIMLRMLMCRNIDWVNRCKLDSPGFDFPQGRQIFQNYKTTRPGVGLTLLPVQWATWFFLGGKVAGACN